MAEIDVKELTVQEIYNWYNGLNGKNKEDYHDQMAYLLFGSTLDFSFIQAATGLSKAELYAMTPKKSKELAEKVKEVNADFFVLKNLIVEQMKAQESKTQKS